MSWSFSVIGEPAAVAKKAKADFAKNPCIEPEETIRQKVREIIELACTAFGPEYAVKIESYGSQSGNPSQSNSLTLKVEPIYGFVKDQPDAPANQ